MLELLNTFKQGSSYDAALETVYGFDMDGLDAMWRDYVTEQYQSVAGVGSVSVAAIPSALIVALAALASAILLALGLAIESWAWGRGW